MQGGSISINWACLFSRMERDNSGKYCKTNLRNGTIFLSFFLYSITPNYLAWITVARSLCLVVSIRTISYAAQPDATKPVAILAVAKSYHSSVCCYLVATINATTDVKAYECLGAQN